MKIIAHRGSSMDFPDNTIESFQQAISDGVKILETDVCICKDGTLVLSHDNVDRKTGQLISDANPGVILTLDTFLETFSNFDVEFIFDVKEFSSNTTIIKLLMETLNRYGVCGNSTIASFNDFHIEYMRDYRLPGIKIALISERIEKDFFKKTVSKTDIDFLVVPVMHTTRELITNCPVPVLAYTCNTSGFFDYCLKIGVHGVFTDNYQTIST